MRKDPRQNHVPHGAAMALLARFLDANCQRNQRLRWHPICKWLIGCKISIITPHYTSSYTNIYICVWSVSICMFFQQIQWFCKEMSRFLHVAKMSWALPDMDNACEGKKEDEGKGKRKRKRRRRRRRKIGRRTARTRGTLLAFCLLFASCLCCLGCCWFADAHPTAHA